MKKNSKSVILLLSIIIIMVSGYMYWLKTSVNKKLPDIQKVQFLNYSITIPEGWHAETDKEVSSKYYKNDLIFGNKCITSIDELKMINYESKPCNFLKIVDSNNKYIIITDTDNVALGGGGYVPTITSKEMIKANSLLNLVGEFKFIYEGSRSNNTGLYYAIGCFNKDLCVHSNSGVNYNEFKSFLNQINIQ